MRRATIFGVWALCAGLAVACGNNRQAQANNDTGASAPAANAFRDQAGSRPQPVDIRGCLTASGDRFVLTELQDASAGNPTTQTFELTKTATQAIDLKQYVGQEVRVAGEADPVRVAEVREGEAATPAATTGQAQPRLAPSAATGAGTTPKVGTTEEERFAYRKLAVSSVTPTGTACPSATAAPAQGR